MKIAIISDIHQTTHWENIIEQKNDFDKIIFLGDEFDCWTNEWPLQMDNAKNIINFKMDNFDKVDLCWSNHATSYFLDEQCSGYQKVHAIDIKEFYNKYKHLYKVVYVYDKWIFSHAGVSAKWMKSCGINDVHEINRLFEERPNFFRWVGPDGNGNNSNEGPLWIRPEALANNFVKDFNQATGHSEIIMPKIMKVYKTLLVLCDTPQHNYITVLDTESCKVDFRKVL